jgi:hypothetical protein
MNVVTAVIAAKRTKTMKTFTIENETNNITVHPTTNEAGPRRRRRRGAPAAIEPEATPAPRKINFTPEGRQKLADAMKRRWAVKRAAARKAGRKKTP